MANLLIDAVNSRFGSGIPLVNPLQYASPSASRAQPGVDLHYPAAIDGLQQELDMLYARSH
jgi:hypothetical protein